MSAQMNELLFKKNF